MLQSKKHIAKVFDFINNTQGDSNFIVMELLGSNLAKVKRNFPNQWIPRPYATWLLIQMLDAIEIVHDAGFIHWDVKAVSMISNFLE